jgi:antitoxin component YwqK of YwqJK toxin-antitoxin module
MSETLPPSPPAPVPQHEKVLIRNSDGVVTQETTMLGGVLDGETVIYSSRRIAGRLFFKNGKQEGEATYYNDIGEVSVKMLFHDGKKNGEATYFDHNGKTIRKENFENDELQGRRTDFYPTGKAREVVHYHQGLLHGEALRFDFEGKLEERTCYKDGRKVRCPPQIAIKR